MSYKTNSTYPTTIDSRTYFQDATIDNIDTVNNCETLIRNGNVSEALSQLDQADIDAYIAELFNYIEIKTKALQTQLTLLHKMNPMQHEYDAPTDLTTKYIWVSDYVNIIPIKAITITPADTRYNIIRVAPIVDYSKDYVANKYDYIFSGRDYTLNIVSSSDVSTTATYKLNGVALSGNTFQPTNNLHDTITVTVTTPLGTYTYNVITTNYDYDEYHIAELITKIVVANNEPTNKTNKLLYINDVDYTTAVDNPTISINL